ncbi:monooxygenase [Mangrovactinospora gilvigrisea]|uniref:Monooxygenase n=1 Tax=Mangrovactinospora gilvigrisea TaxID=1428644 RepID=A0A1J7C7B1_9ACTN|nr:FAD-dependent monooxygenase [Mangrovactinospora gilvigrisea]OIV35538.1 monooxygenase [Mangrovactinospora gilvigrisea]
MSAVVVAGAGPAGLAVAGELARAGVPVTVLEREAEPPGHCRGFNLNARSLELLDRRGLAAGLLAEGPTVPSTVFVGGARLDLAAMRSGHPYVLGIPQTRVEEVLAAWAAGLGARIVRGRRVTGLDQDADGVAVAVADGAPLRAGWLVGCDGGRSTVRKAAGIAFPGTAARRRTLLGDVVLADPSALPPGPHGRVFAIPRPGYLRILVPGAPEGGAVTLEEFRSALDEALGRRVEIAEARWLTRFGDAARLAERLRAGRVLLAGDAAHIHPPAGAIGVNAALDDAFALGWRLGLVARGLAPDAVLDDYHAERHAAGERLLRSTVAQSRLSEPSVADDPGLTAVRDLLADLATEDATAGPLAETITAVAIRYPVPVPHGHPWEGRMAPDVPLADGGTLAALLAAGPGGVLLRDGAALPVDGWAGRVTAAEARLPGTTAALIRPDGHTAWTAPPTGDAVPSLHRALTETFGPPAPPEAP